ncbi:MAG: hypothetical protein A2172_02315 [Candidatus Woykebacteria bacterium RBG_13_40_15]|uniref:Phosphoglycerate mutase n=1 Tax=Candidatus Woykebacteria bacterium RBG_13_40_15 TaxID=1802593 RepID=A0A1G1W6I2_9BACT|nr:MAG: hypothetical protein A2172_02315 [Candidatus Woykebacteria bacterium RBG_13_40_15]
MKILYLVRHGEALDDVENLYGGSADHEPTEKSLKDAASFAETFKEKGIEIVIASPYLRAKNPATIIAQKLGVSLDFENDLREKNRYGALSGMTKEAAREKYPELVKKIESFQDIEGAEKEDDFVKRVKGAFEKIWQRKEKTKLVLTHMGVIRAGLGFQGGVIHIDHYGWVKTAKNDGKWEILESSGLKYL